MCPFAERCPGGDQCDDHFEGALCGDCVADYFMYNDRCRKCPRVPWGFVAMAVMLVIAAIVFARFNLAHWTFVAAIKQLFSFSQNVNLVELVSVAWPDIYLTIATFFQLLSLSLDVTAPECLAENVTWHWKFYAMLLIFGSTAVLLLLLIATAACCKCRGARDKFKRVFVLLFTAVYTAVATLCTRVFQATDPIGDASDDALGDAGSVPTARFVFDTSVDFYGAAHTRVKVVAGTLLALFLVGIPLAIAVWAQRLLRRDLLRDPAVKSAYGGLYARIKMLQIKHFCSSNVLLWIGFSFSRKCFLQFL